ncbi:MAG: LLM class flavin-dependent oxidoreductase [Chloroflexi bacterium]|nr:LLM class flavin-dependent oxidoreductase [Chloroflexota bacterium]
MSDLQFGLSFYVGVARVEQVRQVEEMGYDSVWTGEHIFFYGPTFDAMTVLAAFAACTSGIKLGTAAFLLPLRPPALAAKEAASVDIISGGRLILGIGVGGEYPKEYAACGVPVNERGPRANEAIPLLRRLWSEENVVHQGRFYQLDGVTLAPKPVQAGGPPIWVTGRSEAAMRRAGRLGDGYMPYLFSPDRYRDGLAKVRRYAQEAGRDPDALVPALYQFFCLADTYEEAKKAAAADLQMRYAQPFEHIVERYVVMGNPEDCARRLADFAEAGVRHFILVPIAPWAEFLQHAEAYARDVLPKLKPSV